MLFRYSSSSISSNTPITLSSSTQRRHIRLYNTLTHTTIPSIMDTRLQKIRAG